MKELLPLLGFVKEEPWFGPLVIALVILAAVAFMSSMVIMILKNTREILPSKKSFKKLIQAECEANDELNALVADYGMDRAYLALFHNGRASFGNVCLLNLSVKAEGSSGRHPKITSRMQIMPMLPLSNWMRKVSAGGDIKIDSISKAATDVPDYYPVLEQNSVKSLYIMPVVKPKEGVDGCVFIEYCSEQRTLTDKELDQIRVRAQAIYTKLSEANNV